MRVALLGAALAGCAPATIGWFDMAPRLEFHGFSFDRPPNPHWYVRRSEATPTHVLVRREPTQPSDTHGFHASVGLGELDAQPQTHEEFGELALDGPDRALRGPHARVRAAARRAAGPAVHPVRVRPRDLRGRRRRRIASSG